ncbi:MAG TPA: hypothetical protein VEN30_09915, partial [Paraburkholderia sp.]|nr:hypothetical protein [Paraburkholderia sp.]
VVVIEDGFHIREIISNMRLSQRDKKPPVPPRSVGAVRAFVIRPPRTAGPFIMMPTNQKSPPGCATVRHIIHETRRLMPQHPL